MTSKIEMIREKRIRKQKIQRMIGNILLSAAFFIIVGTVGSDEIGVITPSQYLIQVGIGIIMGDVGLKMSRILHYHYDTETGAEWYD